MFGENVCGLTVRNTVYEVEQLFLIVTVQERQVDAMLPIKVPHGIVLAGLDDFDGRLIVSAKLHRERAPGKELQEVQHGNGLFAESMVRRHKLAFC